MPDFISHDFLCTLQKYKVFSDFQIFVREKKRTTILTEISTKITLPWLEVVEIVRVLHKLRSEIE